MNDDQKLYFKMANAKLYGIYCDKEISPVDPEFNGDKKAVYWDDWDTKDPDEFIESLKDHFEDDETALELLNTYDDSKTESQKWDFIDDLEWHINLPDNITFYHYRMESTLVGVCFTSNEAKRLVEMYDTSLNPRYYVLGRSDLKGYDELSEVIDYFKNKAKENFDNEV